MQTEQEVIEQPDRDVFADELADHMRVGKSTISRWIREDRIPKPTKYVTRKVYYWRRSLLLDNDITVPIDAPETRQ